MSHLVDLNRAGARSLLDRNPRRISPSVLNLSRAKVLIVDDSTPMRSVLTEILKDYSEFEVVCTAQDPYDASPPPRTGVV